MLLDVYARHRALRDEFATICVEAGLSVELEKGPDNLQLENVLIDGVADFSLDLDFSVMHPLQPSNDLAEMCPGKMARQTMHSKSVRVRLLVGAGFVVVPVSGRSHWHRMGVLKNPSPFQTYRAKRGPEAPMLKEGSWRRLQNTSAAFSSPQLVSTARACIAYPSWLGGNPEEIHNDLS